MSQPKPTFLVTFERWPDAWMDELRAVAPGSTIIQPRSREGIPWEEVVALNGNLNREILAKSPKLKWFHSPAAGVEGYLFPGMVASPVVLTNSRGVYGIFIAEIAMAHVLAHTTRLLANIYREDRRTWLRNSLRGFELYESTALIIGLGSIGSEIAKRARAFSMKLIALDPVVTHADGVEVHPPEEIDEVLPRADVLFISAPATTARGLLNRERIFRMKKGAYLVNVSRGPIVETNALVEALQCGHLAGAGLEVVEPEPLPPDHPLWSMTNVTITPHIGGMTDQVDRRRFECLKENLRRFVLDEPLLHIVDKKRGY